MNRKCHFDVFTVTLDQFNASSLNKSINSLKKKLTEPKVLNSIIYLWQTAVISAHVDLLWIRLGAIRGDFSATAAKKKCKYKAKAHKHLYKYKENNKNDSLSVCSGQHGQHEHHRLGLRPHRGDAGFSGTHHARNNTHDRWEPFNTPYEPSQISEDFHTVMSNPANQPDLNN